MDRVEGVIGKGIWPTRRAAARTRPWACGSGSVSRRGWDLGGVGDAVEPFAPPAAACDARTLPFEVQNNVVARGGPVVMRSGKIRCVYAGVRARRSACKCVFEMHVANLHSKEAGARVQIAAASCTLRCATLASGFEHIEDDAGRRFVFGTHPERAAAKVVPLLNCLVELLLMLGRRRWSHRQGVDTALHPWQLTPTETGVVLRYTKQQAMV